ncbi:MAG TPA: SRPBCC family protein [Candidatus Polarisedimenticolia bacterium]|nr:SRPBCC family protein [Candidatus Polarisedimenticolia bacterium]
MKYTFELEIDRPRQRVVELFDNPDNLMKWMPDLIRFEPVSGVPGQVDAQSRLTFRTPAGELEMLETVTARNLPHELSGVYETKMGVSRITNRFVESGGKTRWIADTDFQGVGAMKLMALAMGSAIRSQTEKVMRRFKEFAESQPV